MLDKGSSVFFRIVVDTITFLRKGARNQDSSIIQPAHKHRCRDLYDTNTTDWRYAIGPPDCTRSLVGSVEVLESPVHFVNTPVRHLCEIGIGSSENRSSEVGLNCHRYACADTCSVPIQPSTVNSTASPLKG